MNRPNVDGSVLLTGDQARQFPEFSWNKPLHRKAEATLALREPCAMAAAGRLAPPRMMMDPEPIYERVVLASFEVGNDDNYGMAEVAMVLWPNEYTHAKHRRVVMQECVESWRLRSGWSRRAWFEGMMRRLFSEAFQ